MIKRVFKLLSDRGLNDTESRKFICNCCGVSRQAVNQWENSKTGEIKAENAGKLAKALNTSADFIITGKHPKGYKPSDVSSYLGAVKEVRNYPIIHWTDIQVFASLNKEDYLGEGEGVYEDMGDDGFILIADNEAMWPRYFEGDQLKISPKFEKKNGDHVIVKLGDGRIVFRVYKKNSEGEFLETINTDWPEKIIKLDDKAEFLGLCVNYPRECEQQ